MEDLSAECWIWIEGRAYPVVGHTEAGGFSVGEPLPEVPSWVKPENVFEMQVRP